MPDAKLPAPALTVAQALQGMPLETPGHSAWPALAAQLPAQQVRRRWPLAMLAAAALAALSVLPGRLATPPGDPAAPVASAQANGTIDLLMAESAQLEALLGAVSRSDMATASATLLDLDFQDQLQQIDAALAAEQLGNDQRQGLWIQRVAVLRQYASLQGTQQWLAANGGQLDATLVAAY